MKAELLGLIVLTSLTSVHGIDINNKAVDDQPFVSVGDATFSHVACWSKGQAFEALTGDAFASTTMTLEECGVYCGRWNYFGVAAGTECKI
jgi:hypothetical protein